MEQHDTDRSSQLHQPLAPASLKRKQPKSFIIGLIVLCLVSMVAIGFIGWLVYTTTTAKSQKQDAYAARGVLSNVRLKLSSHQSALTAVGDYSLPMTENQVSDLFSTLQDKLSNYKTKTAELSNFHIFVADTAAKKLYDKYNTKNAEYIKYSQGIIDSKSSFLALSICDAIDNVHPVAGTSYKTSVLSCKSNLGIAKMSNDRVKKLVEAYTQYANAAEMYTDDKSVLSTSDPNYYTKLSKLEYNFSKAYDQLHASKQSENNYLRVDMDHYSPENELYELQNYALMLPY